MAKLEQKAFKFFCGIVIKDREKEINNSKIPCKMTDKVDVSGIEKGNVDEGVGNGQEKMKDVVDILTTEESKKGKSCTDDEIVGDGDMENGTGGKLGEVIVEKKMDFCGEKEKDDKDNNRENGEKSKSKSDSDDSEGLLSDFNVSGDKKNDDEEDEKSNESGKDGQGDSGGVQEDVDMFVSSEKEMSSSPSSQKIGAFSNFNSAETADKGSEGEGVVKKMTFEAIQVDVKEEGDKNNTNKAIKVEEVACDLDDIVCVDDEGKSLTREEKRRMNLNKLKKSKEVQKAPQTFKENNYIPPNQPMMMPQQPFQAFNQSSYGFQGQNQQQFFPQMPVIQQNPMPMNPFMPQQPIHQMNPTYTSPPQKPATSSFVTSSSSDFFNEAHQEVLKKKMTCDSLDMLLQFVESNLHLLDNNQQKNAKSIIKHSGKKLKKVVKDKLNNESTPPVTKIRIPEGNSISLDNSEKVTVKPFMITSSDKKGNEEYNNGKKVGQGESNLVKRKPEKSSLGEENKKKKVKSNFAEKMVQKFQMIQKSPIGINLGMRRPQMQKGNQEVLLRKINVGSFKKSSGQKSDGNNSSAVVFDEKFKKKVEKKLKLSILEKQKLELERLIRKEREEMMEETPKKSNEGANEMIQDFRNLSISNKRKKKLQNPLSVLIKKVKPGDSTVAKFPESKTRQNLKKINQENPGSNTLTILRKAVNPESLKRDQQRQEELEYRAQRQARKNPFINIQIEQDKENIQVVSNQQRPYRDAPMRFPPNNGQFFPNSQRIINQQPIFRHQRAPQFYPSHHNQAQHHQYHQQHPHNPPQFDYQDQRHMHPPQPFRNFNAQHRSRQYQKKQASLEDVIFEHQMNKILNQQRKKKLYEENSLSIQAKKPPVIRKGDWGCKQCGNINWAKRNKCNL